MTATLEMLDAHLDMIRSVEGRVCRHYLFNAMLGFKIGAYRLAREASDPWRRSFEMRAEEADDLAGAILDRWRLSPCAPSCGCDCAEVLAIDLDPCHPF